jgi:hypothetical protein
VKAGFLLDVNVLIAMAWPTRRAHGKVQEWLARHASGGWATCPLTQTAFIGILSNPAFSPNALTPSDAAVLLLANLGHPAHWFSTDDIGFAQALEPFVPTANGPSPSDERLFARTGDPQEREACDDGSRQWLLNGNWALHSSAFAYWLGKRPAIPACARGFALLQPTAYKPCHASLAAAAR